MLLILRLRLSFIFLNIEIATYQSYSVKELMSMSIFLTPQKTVDTSPCPHLVSFWRCSKLGGSCAQTVFDGCRNAYPFKLPESEKLIIGNGVTGENNLLVLTSLRLLFLRVHKDSLWVAEEVALTDISEAYPITDKQRFTELRIVTKDGRHGETKVQIDSDSLGNANSLINNLSGLISSGIRWFAMEAESFDYNRANSLTSVIRFVNAINRLI